MPTPATERPGMGAAAKRVAEHASALARLELELAGLEVKGKVAALGTGVGIGIAAALFAVFALAFALAAGAAALALVLDTWLSLLAGALLLLALILGFVALRAIRRGSPPVPEQAIEEARRTTAALREDGHA
jgi:membrane protein implicated in regulation of membrane protease activity